MSNKLEQAVVACRDGNVEALQEVLSEADAPRVNEQGERLVRGITKICGGPDAVLFYLHRCRG